jgi:hypothetical protein
VRATVLLLAVTGVLATELPISAQAAEDSRPPWQDTGCDGVSPTLKLSASDLAAIRRAVRLRSRSRVIRIGPVTGGQAPEGVLQAVTIVKGNCDSGDGVRWWVRRGRHGWRVVKNAGYDGWVTVS